MKEDADAREKELDLAEVSVDSELERQLGPGGVLGAPSQEFEEVFDEHWGERLDNEMELYERSEAEKEESEGEPVTEAEATVSKPPPKNPKKLLSLTH